jgi:nitroimidazol reductase NimA-like FMN-containing flavoprotein (pyridoxamine 5'-phosphate oxidase superfamily)
LRRADKQIHDREEQQKILDFCKVLRLGIVDAGEAYVVPMNFGYEWNGDGLCFYVHSAKEGRKITALKANGRICFEMDCAYGLIEDAHVCESDFAYLSIIGRAQAVFVQEFKEKEKALQKIVFHQTGRSNAALNKKAVDAVAVIKIAVIDFEAKRSPADGRAKP